MEIIQRYMVAQTVEDAKAQTWDRGYVTLEDARRTLNPLADTGCSIYHVTWIKHVECVWPPM